jgi:hypothetical protein
VTGRKTEEEGGEFADFLADISEEIAERVSSLPVPEMAAAPPPEEKKQPAPPEPGVILDWADVTDRMIEEMH